jgi:hypothetical protein
MRFVTYSYIQYVYHALLLLSIRIYFIIFLYTSIESIRVIYYFSRVLIEAMHDKYMI